MSFALGSPARIAGGWSVPTTVYGRLGSGFGYRVLSIDVTSQAGRLVASPSAASPVRDIRTIEDAMTFLEGTLTARVVPPAGLPTGVSLARDPVSAWSWSGRTTGSLNLTVSTPGGRTPLTITYGNAGFGCIASVHTTLATDTPASVTGRRAGTTYIQVAWPTGPHETSGPFGVSAELPRRQVLAIAAAMDAERLAARR
jgi:hypothetical protein